MTLLARFSHSHPGRVDQVLGRLATLPQWDVITASPDGERTLGPADQGSFAVGLLALLAARHGTPHAHSVVSAWLSRPVDNPERTKWTITHLRDLLNPSVAVDRPAQERAFKLALLSLGPLRDAFREADQTSVADNDLRGRATNVIKIADNLAQQLYFASGAFDEKRAPAESTPRGDQSRFSVLALPLLEGLSTIHFPAITQHIVEIVNHIHAAEPKRALLIAASAVTGDKAYPREPLGLDATLQLVRRYSADHRRLVLNDPQCTAAVRALLEAFVRLGWDKAIDLAEELDDVFS